MSDWDSWQPSNPAAAAQAAYQARVQAARTGAPIAKPLPTAAAHAAPSTGVGASGRPSRFGPAAASPEGGRAPLPDPPAFSPKGGFGRGGGGGAGGPPAGRPFGGRGGPPPPGAGPPTGHLDRGWGSKTGSTSAGRPGLVASDRAPPNADISGVAHSHTRREPERPRGSDRHGDGAGAGEGRDVEERMRKKLSAERADLDGKARRGGEDRDSRRSGKGRERSRTRSRSRSRSRDRRSDAGRHSSHRRSKDDDRERDRDRDRARDRDERRRSDRKRERSRSRSRDRDRDRRRGGRDDHRDGEQDRRRDRDRADDGESRTSKRSRRRDDDRPSSARPEDRPTARAESAKPVAAKDEPDDERKRRDDTPPAANAAPGPAPADPAVIAGDAFLPVVDIEKPFLTKGFKSFAELSKKPRIRIQNLEVGTSVEDIEETFKRHGKILGVRGFKQGRQQVLAFEVVYEDIADAEDAEAAMDGIDADGHILSVRVIRHPEDIAPASTPAEGSLLSRIAGESAHVNGARTAEPAQATASASDSVPVSLLQPFDSLLRRAGVYDLATLRKLVRPGKSKEYVEMLAAEFPEEESLRGLTGKWALRERLEEWLGEKADGRDALEWGNRPATGGSRRR